MGISKMMKQAAFGFLNAVYCPRIKVKNNRIAFVLSRTHEDNSLVLFDYIYKTSGNAYEYVFVVKAEDYEHYCRSLKKYPVKVYSYKHNLLQAAAAMTSSKYVFFMRGRPFSQVRKKPEQLAFNLWHGSGYKDVVVARDGTEFDYVLVPGKAHVASKARFFSCSEDKVLPLGYPRYDLFREIIPQDAEQIRANFQKNGEKLIIWMPTYRATEESGARGKEASIRYTYDLPLLNSADELKKLDEYCRQANVSVLIKRHPHQKKYSGESLQLSNIHFADNEWLSERGIAVYSLLNSTDALISDYSSVAIDYMLLDKPIAFALDDFEQYKAARGFVFDDPLKYMPGHHLYRFEDILRFVDDVAEGGDTYRETRAAIMPEVHNPSENYCRRIWETAQRLAK